MRRRAPIRSRKSVKPRHTGSVILGIFLVGAILYLAVAGYAGSWIAQKVINPVFEFFGIMRDAEQTPSPSASPGVSENPDATDVSIQANGVSAYFLQTGVFSTEENAKTEAAEIMIQGGAGYIALEEEKYQVVLAVYASKEDAQTVKDRLLEQNEMETMIKQKSVGNTTLNMKASLTQKEALEKVLSDLDAVRKDLDAANASIDQLQTAKEHANEAKTTLKNMQTRLAGAFNKGENSFADGLSDLVNNMLLDITAAEEKTDGYVAAGIRHAHVRSYYGYIALLTSMTEK